MEWIAVPGYEDRYEISNHGDIRNKKTGRLLTPYLNVGCGGYLQFTLYLSIQKQQTVYPHRLVATSFLGPKPSPKHEVAHKDGNPVNNHHSNLYWATHKENMVDRTSHGTHFKPFGSLNGKAKLSLEKVREIKIRLRNGESTKTIASDFLVTKAAIDSIKYGHSWGYV